MNTTKIDNHTYIIVLATIAAIAGFLFGFDTGIISGALQFISKTFHIITTSNRYLLHTPQYSVLGLFNVSGTTIQEFIVSAVPTGALIGAIISGKAASFFGRRGGIIATAIIFFIGTAIAASAPNINTLLCGRLLMGFAVGLSAMVAPLYLSEVAPPTIRGAVVFLYQMAITMGLLGAFIINYLFASYGDWRAMFAVGLIPSLLLAVGMMFLPQSPRWLLLKGRKIQAEENLRKLRGNNNISDEISNILESVARSNGNISLLLSKKIRPLIIITFGLFVFQQLTGINTIFYYAPTLFKAAGFASASTQILASVSTGAINVIATLFGIWFVDSLGRKKLLYIGLGGIVLCQLTMAAAYHHLLGYDFRWITLCSALMLIAFFAISISGIAYIIMSELFPLNVRNLGMAVASCANWGFNMLVSASFLTITSTFGFGNAYLLYAVSTFIGLCFVIFLVPETKNVSLEQIENNLYKGMKSRNLGHH
ncbi:MAG: sugar porter family MFS transporter [Gammaproteobacteria bacterium]|nr:sugar porter family MFS transporter [Gammaproteobacteria bacterium]